MTAYQMSPNVAPRLRQVNRLIRDAELRVKAEQQVLHSATPHAINRQHFLQTKVEYEEGLLLTVAHVGLPDEVDVVRSASEPLKTSVSRTTHTLKGSRDTKMGRVSKPHGAIKQQGPVLSKPSKIIDPQI